MRCSSVRIAVESMHVPITPMMFPLLSRNGASVFDNSLLRYSFS